MIANIIIWAVKSKLPCVMIASNEKRRRCTTYNVFQIREMNVIDYLLFEMDRKFLKKLLSISQKYHRVLL